MMTGSNPTASAAFGRYRPIAELGRGGMATVFLAAASGPAGFSKLVVIKELRGDLAEDPEFMTMFLDEARLAARLSHPNIVQTFEVESSPARHSIIMEYLDGQPLSRVRNRAAELGEKGAAIQLRVIADALLGLHHAHELRDYDGAPLHVVHRDISPHNVFVTYAGQAKLVDFGIAKAVGSSAQTRTGVIKGKLAYMSPEQAMSAPLDRRADIFSVGVMIWEAACGQRLWKGLEEFGVMHKLATGAIPRLSEVRPDLSPMIDRICARALAVRPEDRYPTAEALRLELEAYIASCRVRLTSQEVGSTLEELFAEDRKKLASIIEDQMKGGRDGSLPQLGPHLSTRSSSALSQGAMVTPPTGVRVAETPRRVGVWIAAAGVTIGALGLAAAGAIVARAKPGPASSVSAFASVTASASAAPAKRARITVSAKPEGAKITLDGEPVRGELEVVEDGRAHALVVEAPGYVSYRAEIHYDRDQAIPVILEKAKPTTVARPAGGHPKPQSSDDDLLGF